jgi:ABC-type nitrate/sulfonate/bicarbonate transport system substrate-binding protein
MSSHRRSSLILAAATLATSALVFSACSGTTTSESTGSAAATDHGDLTIQLSWIKNEEFSGEYFADTEGYYTDAGFDSVTLVPGPSSGATELISGTADVAISDTVSIGSVVASEGAPLKIVGALFQKNPFSILSLANAGNIQTPEDMIGKRIGVQDSNRAVFDALLLANDISPDQVEVVPVQFDTAPLTNGEVDGFISYLTNESLSVAANGYDTVDLAFAENGLPFVAKTLTVTDEAIANDRERVKALLEAEIRGWTDALNDPQGGVDLALNEYGSDLGLDPEHSLAGAEAQIALITSDDTAANGLFTMTKELQEESIESLAATGIDLDVADLFDLSLLDEVYAENPELVDYER